MQPKFSRVPFLKTLVAVVGGNIIYLYIRKWLPESLRHEPFRLDWGIVADFWICVALWGLLDLAHHIVRKLRGGP